jgi:GTP pyrophosphokinase
MLGLPRHSHQAVAESFGQNSIEELYHDIGRAELLPTVMATRVLDEKWSEEPVRNLDNVISGPSGEQYIIENANSRRLRLCSTCEPRPRDNIIGYLRKNGGVTVHQEGCHSLRANRTIGRLMKLGWGAATPRKARLITIQVDVYDRSGLLFDITKPMQDDHINIPFICTPATPHSGEVRIVMSLEVERARQAVRILHQIRALVNVYSVRCLPPSAASSYMGTGTPFYKPE